MFNKLWGYHQTCFSLSYVNICSSSLFVNSLNQYKAPAGTFISEYLLIELSANE